MLILKFWWHLTTKFILHVVLDVCFDFDWIGKFLVETKSELLDGNPKWGSCWFLLLALMFMPHHGEMETFLCLLFPISFWQNWYLDGSNFDSSWWLYHVQSLCTCISCMELHSRCSFQIPQYQIFFLMMFPVFKCKVLSSLFLFELICWIVQWILKL